MKYLNKIETSFKYLTLPAAKPKLKVKYLYDSQRFFMAACQGIC